MYEVEMKYADLFNVDTLNFTCENFNINDKGYKFEYYYGQFYIK